MQPIQKALFDNDGVNIDSEDVAMKVMDDFGYDMVKKYIPDPELNRGDIYREYPGTSTDKIVEALIQKFDLPMEQLKFDYGLDWKISDQDVYIALADKVTLDTNECFTKELKAISGIGEALRSVDQLIGGISNRALATTSRADRMNISLAYAVNPDTGENAGLAELFPDEANRRLSGYDHDNKYVYALNLLGWNPAETVVVEDSLSGVTKAKAASVDFRVIGTVAAKFYEDKRGQAAHLLEAGASIVVTNVRDLPLAVEWLNDGMSMDVVPNFISEIWHSSPDLLTVEQQSNNMSFTPVRN